LNVAAALCTGIALAMCGTAWAGRPLNTDDASILAEGACQLETWLRPSRHMHQFVLQPACNPWGRIEWGASLTRQHVGGVPAQAQLGLQAKTAFKEVETGTWGAGASLGAIRQVGGGSIGTLRSATLILSVAPSQPLVLHMNLGATQAPSRHARANWAGAIEYSINERWTMVAESTGERHGRPTRQFGVRTWLRPESVQLDATLGREQLNGRDESFVTLGLVWVWDKALRQP